MDWTSLIGGSPFGSWALPNAGDPTSAAPGAPTNILPAVAQTSPTPIPPQQPVGILNGQKNPNSDQDVLLSQALKLMSPQASTPQMPQIQMPRPVGSQGINPLSFLTAFNKNPLSALSGAGS